MSEIPTHQTQPVMPPQPGANLSPKGDASRARARARRLADRVTEAALDALAQESPQSLPAEGAAWYLVSDLTVCSRGSGSCCWHVQAWFGRAGSVGVTVELDCLYEVASPPGDDGSDGQFRYVLTRMSPEPDPGPLCEPACNFDPVEG